MFITPQDLAASEAGLTGAQQQEELERRAAMGRPLRSANQLPDEAHRGASPGMHYLRDGRHRLAAFEGGLPRDKPYEPPHGEICARAFAKPPPLPFAWAVEPSPQHPASSPPH
jgi:hypothetical protein